MSPGALAWPFSVGGGPGQGVLDPRGSGPSSSCGALAREVPRRQMHRSPFSQARFRLLLLYFSSLGEGGPLTFFICPLVCGGEGRDSRGKGGRGGLPGAQLTAFCLAPQWDNLSPTAKDVYNPAPAISRPPVQSGSRDRGDHADTDGVCHWVQQPGPSSVSGRGHYARDSL